MKKKLALFLIVLFIFIYKTSAVIVTGNGGYSFTADEKEIKKKYKLYEKNLKAFLESPTLANTIALGESIKENEESDVFFISSISDQVDKKQLIQNLAKFDFSKKNEEIKKALSKLKLDPLDELIRNNVLSNFISYEEKTAFYDNYDPLEYFGEKYSLTKTYATAIESLFKKIKIKFDLSKVEKFLETGKAPKDSWFKNVFTKIKRAFGLSKNIDIVDVTNLLKNLSKTEIMQAQSVESFTSEFNRVIEEMPRLSDKAMPGFNYSQDAAELDPSVVDQTASLLPIIPEDPASNQKVFVRYRFPDE